MSKDLFVLSAEITGISMIVSGLSNQLDNTETEILTPGAMHDALFGVSNYLDRIASDLLKMESTIAEKARAAS